MHAKIVWAQALAVPDILCVSGEVTYYKFRQIDILKCKHSSEYVFTFKLKILRRLNN